MPHLTHRLRAALADALRDRHTDEPVHFHAGDHGRPYVCEDPRCSSPSLTTTRLTTEQTRHRPGNRHERNTGTEPAPTARPSSADAARSIRHPLARALLVLTFSTGLVDAVSYLGLGRVFTANMTGNIVLLGFGIAGSARTARPRTARVARGLPRRLSPRRRARLDDRRPSCPARRPHARQSRSA